MKSIVAEIIERELCIPAVTVEPLVGGTQNTVYRTDTAMGRYVVRLNQDYARSYAKERWAMQQAAGVGVPVPHVHAVDRQDEYDYMLLDWIEGTAGTAYSGDMVALYRELGRLAQLLSTIRIEGYGRDMEFAPGAKFTKTWAQAVDADEAYIFGDDLLLRLKVLDAARRDDVRGFMREYRAWDLPSCLSHNDLSLDNVIIAKDDRVYLIDWSNACGQPAPFLEMARVGSSVREELLAAFANGYGMSEAEWQGIAATVDRLKIVHSLRAVVWAARDAPAYLDDCKARARMLLDA